MGRKIEVTRLELSASKLRRLASRSQDGRVACRALAIAHVLEGSSRAAAAAACGMDRQTLRDWVHRYNDEGLDGLSDARRSGRPPVLSSEQMGELKELVLAGPDLAVHGVTRWRCIDLCGVIAERYEVVVPERTVGKLLRRLGLTRLQPRPYHPKKDAAAQEAFKKTSPPSSPRSCRSRRPARRSRSGSRTKPASARKARCRISGPGAAAVRRRFATTVTIRPTSSARSARRGPSAPPS